MTLVFYIIIIIITFIAFLHAWSKKRYDLSHTVVINKPKMEVYSYLRQLWLQPNWMPWYARAKHLEVKFKGEVGELGETSYWKGKSKLGEGIQKTVKIKEGKVYESQVVFLKPTKIQLLNYMAVKEIEPGKTKMVWGIRGIHRFPVSIIMHFYGIEKALGKDFEEGLFNLKKILENK